MSKNKTKALRYYIRSFQEAKVEYVERLRDVGAFSIRLDEPASFSTQKRVSPVQQKPFPSLVAYFYSFLLFYFYFDSAVEELLESLESVESVESLRRAFMRSLCRVLAIRIHEEQHIGFGHTIESDPEAYIPSEHHQS